MSSSTIWAWVFAMLVTISWEAATTSPASQIVAPHVLGGGDFDQPVEHVLRRVEVGEVLVPPPLLSRQRLPDEVGRLVRLGTALDLIPQHRQEPGCLAQGDQPPPSVDRQGLQGGAKRR